MVKYVKFIPIILIIILIVYEASKYEYSFIDENSLVGNNISINNQKDYSISQVWKRNDKLILVFKDPQKNDILNYAFFKQNSILGKYKLVHNFSTNHDVVDEAIEVQNVIIAITISQDDIIENSFNIEKDIRQSDLFMIAVYFLVFSYISNLKIIRNTFNAN